MTITAFRDYARYYDLVYRNKNYANEVDYVCNLIDSYKPGSHTLLDIGCGTGRHCIEFARRGYDVTGVDRSAAMLDIAVNRLGEHPALAENILFSRQNIESLSLGKNFDVIVSLFHVMSYITTDVNLHATLGSVKSHLNKEGLFVFDFWYGPAVLHQEPEPRTRHFYDNNMQVTREAEPILHADKNIVDVNYSITISDTCTMETEKIYELHRMRYFFEGELSAFLDIHGFRVLGLYEWLTDRKPGIDTWSVCAVVDIP